ncbi:rCG53029 [Rattus norvegicus]|uniref:RCG53029 n=1 Tax=Rattus norvegicus TaxID=10116 RepID=A6IQJ0_RAT|nr:rCG53029 [Rattus norvegicus]
MVQCKYISQKEASS